jgi:hypothetical protein
VLAGLGLAAREIREVKRLYLFSVMPRYPPRRRRPPRPFSGKYEQSSLYCSPILANGPRSPSDNDDDDDDDEEERDRTHYLPRPFLSCTNDCVWARASWAGLKSGFNRKTSWKSAIPSSNCPFRTRTVPIL